MGRTSVRPFFVWSSGMGFVLITVGELTDESIMFKRCDENQIISKISDVEGTVSAIRVLDDRTLEDATFAACKAMFYSTGGSSDGLPDFFYQNAPEDLLDHVSPR